MNYKTNQCNLWKGPQGLHEIKCCYKLKSDNLLIFSYTNTIIDEEVKTESTNCHT